jgi:hypothetical protein
MLLQEFGTTTLHCRCRCLTSCIKSRQIVRQNFMSFLPLISRSFKRLTLKPGKIKVLKVFASSSNNRIVVWSFHRSCALAFSDSEIEYKFIISVCCDKCCICRCIIPVGREFSTSNPNNEWGNYPNHRVLFHIDDHYCWLVGRSSAGRRPVHYFVHAVDSPWKVIKYSTSKEIPSIYWTRTFIAVFIKYCSWIFFYMPVQSSPAHNCTSHSHRTHLNSSLSMSLL